MSLLRYCPGEMPNRLLPIWGSAQCEMARVQFREADMDHTGRAHEGT